MSKAKTIRCAIYTRKSTEEGLNQEFNSLDAQREASEAYITSQKHEGWSIIPTMYDDGGFSGGNMNRPALKQLLADIETGKVDIVVVYKVDRLSRALGDFAKMVEIFDAHNVSFVSVTQSFNTTTSMGRLTLNVLLSFAQFEREVTGERIRDKFLASKKKGMWMGGPQPLGYDVKHRKLHVNEEEAKIINFIFEYYANNSPNKPLYKLLDVLKTKGYKGKSYISQKGNQIIGKEFNLNQIYNILKNPLYNGKMRHKKEIYDGEHEAIIDDELWQCVQNKISKKEFIRNPNKKSEQPKLTGKIYDYLGHRLSPTYSYKYSENGRHKMRYYINREISTKGKTTSEFKRIRAETIDDVVIAEITALQKTLLDNIAESDNQEMSSALLKPIKNMLIEPAEHIAKIVLFPKHIELSLRFDAISTNISKHDFQQLLPDDTVQISDSGIMLTRGIKAQYKRTGGQLRIITENGAKTESTIEAQYCHANDKTFTFIAKSFYWSKEIKAGVCQTQKDISVADNHSVEYVKKALKQRFLSPTIIEHITSNNHSTQISVENLIQCNHWDWQQQEAMLLSATQN